MARLEPTDEQLVFAINAGDVEAFDKLYHRYRDRVYSLAYRFTGHHEDALDVLQETFVYLLSKFPGFTLSARMTTFLYPAVRNLALAARRKSRRYASGESIDETPVVIPPDIEATRGELTEALRTLPAEQLEVVLMRFVDDFTLAEIADTLNIPTGTAKSRLHNALKTLKNDDRTRGYFLKKKPKPE